MRLVDVVFYMPIAVYIYYKRTKKERSKFQWIGRRLHVVNNKIDGQLRTLPVSERNARARGSVRPGCDVLIMN